MGRSRAVSRAAKEDPTRRYKRRRTASGVEILETLSKGEEISERKLTLYHCNYCNKDISGTVRIRCVACLDFDLCVECFSVGAELSRHKSNHPYRVMDNLSFPLICPDWNADEEMLLLEGIEMYGFGNWAEVADHVGTKSKLECIDHYNAVYMNSPCFPRPDMSHVMGKSREELLAMAKGQGEMNKEFPVIEELTLKDATSVSARVMHEESRKEDSAAQSSSSITAGSISGSTFSDAFKKASSKTQINDGIKVEESLADRRIGEKKPRLLGNVEPSKKELSGYNFKRQEFEVEYDNDAEQLLADMEFNDSDSNDGREMKLSVLRIYLKRLDERKLRKDFILERNLLYPDPVEESLSSEEKKLCRPYRVFMRFHSKEDHEALIKNIIEEYRMLKKVQDLQEARAAGCRTTAEANRFFNQKRKEALESANRIKDSSQAGPSGKVLQRPNHPKIENEGTPKDSVSSKPSSLVTQTVFCSIDDWDVSGFLGAELLSDTEIELCNEIKILPVHYLSMLQTMSQEIVKGCVTKKSDAHSLFRVDPSKIDRVYDVLVGRGIVSS